MNMRVSEKLRRKQLPRRSIPELARTAIPRDIDKLKHELGEREPQQRWLVMSLEEALAGPRPLSYLPPMHRACRMVLLAQLIGTAQICIACSSGSDDAASNATEADAGRDADAQADTSFDSAPADASANPDGWPVS